MQTTQLTTLLTQFNPLSSAPAHLIPRLLLARLPSTPLGAGGALIKTTTKILPSNSKEPARLVIGFKGGETLTFVESTRRLEKSERRRRKERGEVGKGEVLVEEQGVELGKGEIDLGRMRIDDVLEEVGRRCRILGRREMIGGN